MPDMNKWRKGTVTISRERYGKIVSVEMHKLLDMAKLAGVQDKLIKTVKELLLEFSASVATEVFEDADDEMEVE